MTANRNAERMAVGAMLVNRDAIDDVVTIVDADDFSEHAAQVVFRAIVELSGSNRSVGAHDVGELLVRRGSFDDVGGPYLAELIECAGTGSNARYYAEQVRDSAVLRRMELAGRRIAELAASPDGPADDVVAACCREVESVTDRRERAETRHVADLVADSFDRLDERTANRGRCTGIPSGFEDVDHLLGGFRAGELTIIGARPSVGKTALALSIAVNVAAARSSATLFVSLEQSIDEVADRLICLRSGVSLHRYRNGWLEASQVSAVRDAGQSLESVGLFVNDRADLTAGRIAALARQHKRRHGVGLVVVDYLQLVVPDDRKSPRHEQVSVISRRLKLAARDVGVSIIVAAQLNREIENRGDSRPRLSDLRESGSIEQDADKVILLHRPAESPDVIDAIVAKHRNGPTGDAKLYFRREVARFESYAPGVA